jgi:16S rRNA G966 N2-methylase RsmD
MAVRSADQVTPYYDHGGIVIYHGDCREILPALEPADLVLTDPPYGVLAATGSAATRRATRNTTAGRVGWDVRPDPDVIASVVSAGTNAALWGGCHFELPPTYGYLVWDKRIDGLNFGEVEFCWTTGRFAPRVHRERAVMIDGGRVHPTQKPEALMRWCMGFFPDAGVLDPFMGSGTTLRAAKDLGRKAIGIEIEERYCEIAAKRLAQEVFDFST